MEGVEAAQAAEGIGAVWTILITAGLSVAATLGTTWFGHWLGLSKDKELRDAELERLGTYLAVRVSSVLDPFVMSAVEIVNDRGYRDPEGELGPETVAPMLDLPTDVDWKSIDPHLMDRILSMPNEIATAEKSISFTGEMTSGPPDHDEWFNERRYQWSKLGLTALNLARDLRTRYRLPQRDYSRYDPRDVLEAAFLNEDEMRAQGAVSAKRIVAKAKAKKAAS